MKRIALIAAMTAFALGSAYAQQAEMIIDKDSGKPGEGQTVAFKGTPLPLVGTGLEVGKPLPAAMVTALTEKGLTPVDVSAAKGKVRIISVVPSVDTPVCEAQTHALSEKTGVSSNIELVTISMDLPFAQARFAKEAKIKNVTFLSDYQGGQFGNNNGLLIKPLGLLARTVIVTDKDNVVRYLQVVPEITHLPDFAKAVEVAKSL
jgi:thioredoxin-dependent peroxiredoxin